MKILIFTNHSYMLWQFRRELIAELMKKHQVVLSMPFVGHEEDFSKLGCVCIDTPIDRRGINPITDLKLYRFYWNLLKKEKPGIVITFSIKPNIYVGYACNKLKIPFCSNVQGLGTAFQKKGLSKIVTGMYRAAFRQVQTVFFENQENAEEFLKRKIIPAEKQTLLNGAGVNLEYYKEQPYPPEESIRFLFVGRIMKEKGVEELFAAAQQLKKRYGEKVIFDVVGFFEDAYKAEVEKLKEEGVLLFHGFQEEIRPFYKQAHCVVLPSYHEGMSNVLLEAAACGRPLITTDIPGCREAVEDGVTGFLCQAHDTGSLFDRMDQFLAMAPEQRMAMGRAGRQKMALEFDKNRIVAQTVAAIFQEHQEEIPCLIS